MNETRQHSKARRFWDGHGSWLILVVVALSCWMAGSQFNAATTAKTIEVLVRSQDAQDESYRARLRELHDRLEKQASELGPQIHQAAADASRAADKATEASNTAVHAAVTAAKAVDKAGQ